MNKDNENKYLEIMRGLSSGKKLEQSFELFDFAKARVLAEIKRLNPKLSKAEANVLANKRFVRV